MTEWRVFVLGEGDHAACLSVVTDDERQVRLMVADIPPGDTADGVLAEHGWRLDGPWEEGDGSRHAPVRRAGRGRIPRGERCETKLPPDVLGEVEALVGVLGADRSEVIAVLVRVGLEVAADGHTPEGSPYYPPPSGPSPNATTQPPPPDHRPTTREPEPCTPTPSESSG